jgi:hypothetical protein
MRRRRIEASAVIFGRWMACSCSSAWASSSRAFSAWRWRFHRLA